MKYTKPVALRITPEQLEKLQAVADKSQTSVSTIIRQAIQAFLTNV